MLASIIACTQVSARGRVNKEPSLKFALFNGFGVRIGDRPDQLLDKLVSSISHQKKSPLPTSNFLADTVIKEK